MIATRYVFIAVTLVTWQVNSMVSGGHYILVIPFALRRLINCCDIIIISSNLLLIILITQQVIRRRNAACVTKRLGLQVYNDPHDFSF